MDKPPATVVNCFRQKPENKIREKEMQNNERLLLLLRTLQEQSDDETRLTTADLRGVLQTAGYE